jgi:hypothetical protein
MDSSVATPCSRISSKRSPSEGSCEWTAAQEFNWLILSIPLNKAMFHGSDTEFTPGELERYADEGVRVFLAAYGSTRDHEGSGLQSRLHGFESRLHLDPRSGPGRLAQR